MSCLNWNSIGKMTLGAIASLALSCGLSAQVALMPSPTGGQYFDNNGEPCAGCLLYTYASGTTNPQATFTDSTGTVQNTNPIVMNAAGYPSNGGQIVGVWLSSGVTYRVQLTLANSTQVYQLDGISASNPNNGITNFITTVAVPFSPNAVFTATAQTTLFQMTLTGNVVNPTLIFQGVSPPAMVGFEITTDATGVRFFTYPANMIGGAAMMLGIPNTTQTQWFMWDGVIATAIGPAQVATGFSSYWFWDTSDFPAQSGWLRGNRFSSLKFRNQLNTLDLNGLSKQANDVIQVGDSTGVQIGNSPTAAVSGTLKQATGDTFCWRTTGNTGDVCLGKNNNDQFTGPFDIATNVVTTVNNVSNGATLIPVNQQLPRSINALGKVFKVRTTVNFTVGTNSTSTLYFGLGNTSALGSLFSVATQAAATTPWQGTYEMMCVVNATGVGGNLTCAPLTQVLNGTATIAGSSASSSFAIDLTGNVFVGAECGFGTPAANNSCASQYMTVELLN